MSAICAHGYSNRGYKNLRRWLKRKQCYVIRRESYCKTCDNAGSWRRSGSGKPLTGVGKGWRRFETTCPKGHPYEGSNLGVIETTEKGELVERRQCLTCRRETVRKAARRYYWRQKAKVAA